MKELRPLIVVEGKTDIEKVKQVIDADFITTNGSDLSEDTLLFIEKASVNHKIIILTDPDQPGERIRTIINQRIPNCYNAYVRKEHSIKKHKLGVAEADLDEIRLALENIVKYNYQDIKYNLTQEDLYDLGLVGQQDSSNKRKIISDYYHLGNCNSKCILKKLNMLNIERKDIEKLL